MMAPNYLILALFSSIILSVSSQIEPPALTIHELLPKYGLPGGLFPDSVISYNVSEDDHIVIELGSPCTVEFEYLIWYDTRVTGKLRYGSITGLKGIQLQRLYVWLEVSEIRVESPPTDDIYFHVIMFDNTLNVDQFKTVHSCSKNANSKHPLQGKAIDDSSSSSSSSKALVADE